MELEKLTALQLGAEYYLITDYLSTAQYLP